MRLAGALAEMEKRYPEGLKKAEKSYAKVQAEESAAGLKDKVGALEKDNKKLKGDLDDSSKIIKK